MNERILELADQCEGRTICDCGEIGFNFEKFAELIIKECIELNKQELAFNAFERMLNRYKEHFGVEE
jgi:hypothetical protein